MTDPLRYTRRIREYIEAIIELDLLRSGFKLILQEFENLQVENPALITAIVGKETED